MMCFPVFLSTYHLMWWASPLMKLCWVFFLHQEQGNGNTSALSCCLHLPCESYGFWWFLLGVKFMKGLGKVFYCLWWTGACRKNVWEPEKSIATFLVDCRKLDSAVMWVSSGLKGISVHHFLTFLILVQILDLLILDLFQLVLLGNYRWVIVVL